jgi:polysaccharide biosynthesis/export protein
MRNSPIKTGTMFLFVGLTVLGATGQESTPVAGRVDSGYQVGPDDQIVIRVVDAPEISEKPFLIGLDGYVTLPMIGRVQTSGLTVGQMELLLDARLKLYVRDPQVSVMVAEFRSQPVSVFGAVSKPGIVQLRGRKTLYEVFSIAGGPTDVAGRTLTLTRRSDEGEIPLPGVMNDPSGKFSTAEVNMQDIMDGKNPTANIEVKPNDTISVSLATANMIYVVGDVEHGGAFTLGGRQEISVLRALSLAGGLGRTAKPEKARIFRGTSEEGKPQEIAINLRQIFSGKGADILLLPQDVLVIPTSSRKVFQTYTVPSMLSAAASAAIYR